MELLGIKELRRGAERRTRRPPNAANYDESKANPYPDLPDPLVLQGRQEGHDRRGVVEEAAAGDRRGLRPRGLRPGAQGHARR